MQSYHGSAVDNVNLIIGLTILVKRGMFAKVSETNHDRFSPLGPAAETGKDHCERGVEQRHKIFGSPFQPSLVDTLHRRGHSRPTLLHETPSLPRPSTPSNE
jgi:hypothetical protein